MNFDAPDIEIRTNVFAWLSRVTDAGERAIGWRELTTGFIHNGEQVALIGQKGIWKPRQMELPLAIVTAPPRQSGQPAPYDDEIADDGLLKYRYEGTDPSLYTNRWLRECWRQRVPLVYFHGIAKGLYLATWPVLIVEDDPTSLSVLVEMLDPARIRPDLPTHIADAAERRFYNRLTRQRLGQATFRERVLRAYRRRCSICRLGHSELLDAAHIVPFARDGLSSVDNGLSLCKIHHAAYDHNILGVSPTYELRLRKDLLDEIDGPMLRHGLQEVHGSRLALPRKPDERPRAEFLEQRWAQFRAAR